MNQNAMNVDEHFQSFNHWLDTAFWLASNQIEYLVLSHLYVPFISIFPTSYIQLRSTHRALPRLEMHYRLVRRRKRQLNRYFRLG